MITRILTALALCLLTATAGAEGFTDDTARVDLLPGWRSKDGAHMAALSVELAPGWKTYWRAPGDAGIPPRFDFAGSQNIASVAFLWPTPEVFSSNGMTSVGYAHRLILPIRIQLQDASAPSLLRAEVDMGVCHDICVPLSVTVAADLPAADVHPDARIRAALADRPMTAAEAGAGRLACNLGPATDGIRLDAQLQLPSMGGGEFAVIELGDPGLWVSEARLQRQGQKLTASVDVVAAAGGAVAVDRTQVRVTVIGARGAVDLAGCS